MDVRCFATLLHRQVMQQAVCCSSRWAGRDFILFSILFFSNLNWNERVIIIINSPRKCMGCSYFEGFTLQRNENWPVCSWTTESIWFKLCFIFTGCTFLICITKLKLTSLTNFFVILLICTGCMVENSAPPFWKCCFSHLGIAKYFVLVWVGIS